MEKLSDAGESEDITITLSDGIDKICFDEGASVEESIISMLEDHILENIFEHLHESDLINVEQVCQKWNDICHKIWSRKRSLEFDHFLDFDVYDVILSRCGSNLTHFCYLVKNFYVCPDCVDNTEKNLKADFFVEYNNRIIPPIVKYCKNLTSFELLGLNQVEEMVLDSLANCSFFTNLTSLTLCAMELSDHVLEIILEKAANLKKLNLNSAHTLQGHSLMKLSKGCETLIVTNCCCLHKEALRNALKRLPNLQELGAYSLEIISLSLLIDQTNLVRLLVKDTEIFKDLSYDEIPLLTFSCLKTLNISYNSYVTDYVLSMLRVICPNLEELDLSGCYSSSPELKQEISNFGISRTVKLPNLKWLKLNELTKLDFAVVVFFANGVFNQLKKLECHKSGGNSMTVSGLSSMINICPNLEYLDLSCNSYLSGDFLFNVFNSVDKESRDKKIKVFISAENSECQHFFGEYLNDA